MPDVAPVLASWRELRFAALQAELAALAPQLADAQRHALVSRKSLADRTREFKRQSPESQLEGIRALLKAYQGEIDALTTRAKHAESTILDLETRLRPAADPFPVLETLASKADAAHDIDALRAELAHAIEQRDTIQRKYTAAEARIGELVQRDAAIASDAAARVDEARADAERRAADREASLHREITALQGHLRELRASHEQVSTQLLSAPSEAPSDAHAEQVETLMRHLQDANARAAQAERRIAALRAESEQARTEETQLRHQQVEHLQARLAELERALAQQRDTQAKHEADAQRASDAQRAQLVQRVETAETDVATLRQALAQRADYDEMKRELDVLKAVEFAGENDEAEDEANGAPSGASSLETHLVRRNRKLQDELATLRASVTDFQRRTAQSDAELDAQRTRIHELEALAKRLETDLLHAAPEAPKEPQAGTSGLLPIVTSQRDRFRQRNTELEQELRTQLEAMAEQRAEIKRLQADNVSMYEKVRYLQNYGKSAPTEMPYPPTARGNTESAYRARYEQSINPFEVFRGQEQSRALASLSPVDRLLHVFTSAVLGNAQMRLIFVCYAVVLHLLVFGILLDVGHRAVEAQ
ncbi:hypothetical protein MBRA1_002146 [Malassezia brasiliensis]|uniref:Protein CASP n=1 Tax=Malassezia brasiliensis TaxID=1821822 RepID=A0AAF0DU45_9BASI|nr:hypothetical protein MBRA1_002146 [Malassezia brasiliensis]